MEPESGWYPGVDCVNILNEKGNNERTVVYVNEAMAAGWSEALEKTVKKGWYDANDVGEVMEVTYDTTPIDFGTAIQVNIYSDSPDAGAVFSGQVKAEPTITDVINFMGVANCAPVDMTLGDLKVNCDETTMEPESGWYPGVDCVNILNEKGNNERTVVYVNEAMATGWSEALEKTVKKGWYDANDIGEVMEVTYDTTPIPAGEGIQVNVYSGSPDVTVQIDSAL